MNFRPYFRSLYETNRNKQHLRDALHTALTEDSFIKLNCLGRILRLAGLDITVL